MLLLLWRLWLIHPYVHKPYVHKPYVHKPYVHIYDHKPYVHKPYVHQTLCSHLRLWRLLRQVAAVAAVADPQQILQTLCSHLGSTSYRVHKPYVHI